MSRRDSVPLTIMLCPSDTYNTVPFSGSGSSMTVNIGPELDPGELRGQWRTGFRELHGPRHLDCGAWQQRRVGAIGTGGGQRTLRSA